MADYIKREDVLAKKQTIYFEYFDSDSGYVEEEGDLAVTVEDILKIPAADVRPVVRGKWIQDCDYHFRCSACGDRLTVSNGHPLDVANGWSYCPNCGADMRGNDDEI